MANEVVKILCRRDGISEREAEGIVNEALERMEEVDYDAEECENIAYELFGLEMDLVMDMLIDMF